MTGDFLTKYLVFYDLGTSYNFFNDIKRFKYYKICDLVFVNIGGRILYVIGTGEVKIIIITIKGKRKLIIIIKAFYILSLYTNIINKDFFYYNGLYFNGKRSVLRWFFNNTNYYKIIYKYSGFFFKDNVVINNLKEYNVFFIVIRTRLEILKADL